MIEAQTAKYAAAIPPAAIVDDGTATAVTIDTLGYDYAEIVVALGATDIAMAALKVQESDDDSTYTDVSGSVFGTDSDIEGSATTLPSATDDNGLLVFQLNLLGKKRYLQVVATAGNGAAGTFITAFARLSRGNMPVTNAEAGAVAVVRA